MTTVKEIKLLIKFKIKELDFYLESLNNLSKSKRIGRNEIAARKWQLLTLLDDIERLEHDNS